MRPLWDGGGGFCSCPAGFWGSPGHPRCGSVLPEVIPLFQRGCGLPGPRPGAPWVLTWQEGEGGFGFFFEMTLFPAGGCSSSGPRANSQEILSLGAFRDVQPLQSGCWDTLARFCFPMGSRDGAWPCLVLTPPSGRAGLRMFVLPRFSQTIPAFPKPFPTAPPCVPQVSIFPTHFGLLWRRAGSREFWEHPQPSAPIPPCPIPAQPSSAIPARFPRRIR